MVCASVKSAEHVIYNEIAVTFYVLIQTESNTISIIGNPYGKLVTVHTTVRSTIYNNVPNKLTDFIVF